MRKKTTIFTIILYLILVTFILSITLIYYLQKKLGSNLIICAENQITHLTNIIINNSIKNYQSKNNFNNILTINKNNKNEITLIEYNTITINKLKTELTEIIEKDILYMIKGKLNEIYIKLKSITDNYYEQINKGIIFTIPIGSATGNPFLANLGPKIPIKLSLVDNVSVNIETKVTEYGLNNAMIEIYLKTEVITNIQMPFLSKQIKVDNQMPISIQIIQGILPKYYLENLNQKN